MKALIIEDSRLARDGLARMLKQYPEIDVVGKAADAHEAQGMVEKLKPDVLFLDIHMPGKTGLELLEELDELPHIIFTTAYSEYAIKSFEYPTVDYLLKPISAERLEVAITKLLAAVNSSAKEAESETVTGAEVPARKLDMTSKIFIKDGDACHLVELNDIYYIESCKNYVRAFFNDNKAFIRKNMTQVEESLPSTCFFRASRQAIINLNHIASIEQSVGDGYDVTLKGGLVTEVSRRNAARLKEMLSF